MVGTVQNDRLGRMGGDTFWGMSALGRRFDRMSEAEARRLSLDLALSRTSKYMKKAVRLLVDCNQGISIASLLARLPPRLAVDVHWPLSNEKRLEARG